MASPSRIANRPGLSFTPTAHLRSCHPEKAHQNGAEKEMKVCLRPSKRFKKNEFEENRSKMNESASKHLGTSSGFGSSFWTSLQSTSHVALSFHAFLSFRMDMWLSSCVFGIWNPVSIHVPNSFSPGLGALSRLGGRLA